MLLLTNNVGIIVAGMFIILALGDAFKVVESLEVSEHFSQPILFNKIYKSAAILVVHESIWFDHAMTSFVLIEFRVSIISRGHDDNSSRYDRPLN